MDGDTLVETVTDRMATELNRLGSEKALVAATEAQLARERVLASALVAERRAAETFEQWADTETTPEAESAFERVADTERDHADRVAALMTDPDTVDADPAPDALHEHLRSLDATPERVAAGLVARPLVSERSLLQVVNFFVNEVDERTADTVRYLRSETEALVDDGAALLDICCERETEWERATEAAERTVAVAYDEYADRLHGMGVDPAPVC
ncbi:MAG: rubrerythrin family protein [Haloplanus sp.]